MINFLSVLFPALIVAGCALLPLIRGRQGYSLFLQGAKEGLSSAVGAAPAVLALLVCLRIWGATGLGERIGGLLGGSPWSGALPLIGLRPFSGGGSLGILADLIARMGPDAPAALLAACVMGATETFFYTATVYYAASGKKMGKGLLWRAFVVQGVAVLVCFLLL